MSKCTAQHALHMWPTSLKLVGISERKFEKIVAPTISPQVGLTTILQLRFAASQLRFHINEPNILA